MTPTTKLRRMDGSRFAADQTVYLVYCDYGAPGIAIRETEPTYSEGEVIRDILDGQYLPVKVVAFNVAEGWSRDVTEDIAIECFNRLEPGESIRRDLIDFIEAHTDLISAAPTQAGERVAELEASA